MGGVVSVGVAKEGSTRSGAAVGDRTRKRLAMGTPMDIEMSGGYKWL